MAITLKMAGCLLVVVSLGLIGCSIAAAYARRPQELRLLLAALQQLETEIIYGASPLPEALGRVGQYSDPPVRQIFLAAKEYLVSGQGLTAGEAWQMAVTDVYAETALAEADRMILENFALSLGASDREDQVKHITLARAQLQQEEREACEASAKNVRMWKYLGFLTGLAICFAII